MDKKYIKYTAIAVLAILVIIIIALALRPKKPVAEIVLDDKGRVIPPYLPQPTSTVSTGTGTKSSLLNLFSSIEGKAAFAKVDNVTVYDSHNIKRKVIKKDEWAGTVIDEVGSIYRIYFQDGTIGWVTKAQVYLK